MFVQIHGRKGCSFFEWYDEQFPDRSQEVINSLLEKVNDLKHKDGVAKKIGEELQRKIKNLVMFLVFSWILIVILLTRNLKGGCH